MKQNKVMSVFDGNQMQKYFLLLTKQAEEAAYEAMVAETNTNIGLNVFLGEIKNMPQLKKLIQDMILVSISNVDWQESLDVVLSGKRQIS